jgi:predicted dithiol-disulfide oxidoreductase (DUF899 family)
MKTTTASPRIVSPPEWLAARRELLQAEKELTRQQDALAARRRALPWVRVTKPYTFDSPQGRVSLADLFAGCSQLIVQHFMFGPGWEEGCRSCSFMLDHLNPCLPHLKARDAAFAAISHAPLAEILPFKKRMGWTVNWVSAHGTDFNRDFHVSFTPEEIAAGRVNYNFELTETPVEEREGLSVFVRDGAGNVYHTYSAYGRGTETAMGTYHLLDLAPKGRDEDGLEFPMAWIRHRDRYEPAGAAR